MVQSIRGDAVIHIQDQRVEGVIRLKLKGIDDECKTEKKE